MGEIQVVKDLRATLDVYRELYQSFDPDGEIAVHIEFDHAITDAREALEGTIKALANVLEYAKGNRGNMNGNPYCVPEIEAALKHLAKLEGREEWLDVDTKALAEEA